MDRNEIREDAAIVRSLIQAENQMTNDRINWLITIQGLLFATLGFAWKEGSDAQWLITVVSVLGIFVSISSWTALSLANQARANLKSWWEKNRQNQYDGPDIIGIRSFAKDQKSIAGKFFRKLRPWRFLPPLFIAAWIAVLFLQFF